MAMIMHITPMFITGANDLQVYTTTNFESLVQEWIRYTLASSTDGYVISYNINGTAVQIEVQVL